ESQADLRLHIPRAGPAHQRIDLARGLGLVLEQPLLGAGRARLHGGLGRLVDAGSHCASRSPKVLSRGARFGVPARLMSGEPGDLSSPSQADAGGPRAGRQNLKLSPNRTVCVARSRSAGPPPSAPAGAVTLSKP